MSAQGQTSSLAVCVVTRERPDSLAACLDSLARLELPGLSDLRVEIHVVDNDPAASARAVVEAAGSHMRWPLHYHCEAQIGIPHARNRCLEASRGCDFLAFIDDDEKARPRWLAGLLAVQQRYDAQIVFGPIHYVFEKPAPPWIAANAFYAEQKHADGLTRRMPRTGNVLLSRSLFEREAIRFDTAFALTGGSDSHLFTRLRERGFAFYWAGEAGVEEVVVPSRARAAWLLLRCYRVGSSGVLLARRAPRSTRALARRLVDGALLGFWGLASLPLCLLHGRSAALHAAGHLAKAAGIFAGFAGFHYEEYRRSSG